MSITLYTAPDCMRCKIVKTYLHDKDIPYKMVDFKADAEVFNKFYRENRKAIYRNPEGVEFPLFQDDEVIKQGSGEVLAWLLGGHDLEGCVSRSSMLHGKISGLYPGQCPGGQEDNFISLVRNLSDGGLEIWLETDGRNPGLLQKLLRIANVRVILNLVGGPETAARVFGGAPMPEELAKTVELIQANPGSYVRFLALPIPDGDAWKWPDREDAEAAAKMLAESCGKPAMPFVIEALAKDMAWDTHGLEPLPAEALLKYRSAARRHMYKAEIAK